MLQMDEVRAVTQAALEPRAAAPGKYMFYTVPLCSLQVRSSWPFQANSAADSGA